MNLDLELSFVNIYSLDTCVRSLTILLDMRVILVLSEVLAEHFYDFCGKLDTF